MTLHDEESSDPVFKERYGKGKLNYTIEGLRGDLKERLAGYKMPTLLRIVEGDLPKTASGKVLKKQLGVTYFPAEWEKEKEVQVWRPKARVEMKARL